MNKKRYFLKNKKNRYTFNLNILVITKNGLVKLNLIIYLNYFINFINL